jgi:hypothetical protein
LTVQAQTSARHFTRLALVMAAIAALFISLTLRTSPVLAGGPDANDATLNPSQVGTDSADGEFDCPEGDEPVAGQVLWHFVLNGVDPGIASALTIYATFDEDGLKTDTSAGDFNPPGSEHQFFIITSGDDILEGAYVPLPDGTESNNLVLSHICRGEEEATPTPTPEGSQGGGTGTPTPTPEGSQAGGTGTPAPSVPNTALSLSSGGSLATIFFGAVLIASLGALAYANVTAVRRRR